MHTDHISADEMALYMPHLEGGMVIEPKPYGDDTGRWFEQFNIQGGREAAEWEFDARDQMEAPLWISRVEFDDDRSVPLMAESVVFSNDDLMDRDCCVIGPAGIF